MPYECEIILDSINESGDRLTTFVLTYPRFVHSEFMTHRMFSRNSSSSRAIPTARLMKKIRDDPAMPVWWGKNQSGMQAKEQVDDVVAALNWWIEGRDLMLAHAKKGLALGLHKQIVNRIIEPWMWITVICSATEYENFFNLRCHPDAQPEIREFADMMYKAYHESIPEPRLWHRPFISEKESGMSTQDLLNLSVARCARVSYLTHDGTHDLQRDLALAQQLADSGHWSPFEHQAASNIDSARSGNFTGWNQYRQAVERYIQSVGMVE